MESTQRISRSRRHRERKKRRLTVAVAAVALLLVALLAWNWSQRMTPQRRQALRQQLGAEEASVRLTAAKTLLADDPADTEALLAKGGALIELKGYQEARMALASLADRAGPRQADALAKLIESYVEEAKDVISVASAAKVELARERVTKLLAQAESRRKVLSSLSDTGPQTALARARALGVEAMGVYLDMSGEQTAMARADLAGLHDQLQTAGVRLEKLRGQLDELDQGLEQACGRVLDTSPNMPAAQALLFERYLRGADGERTRQIAQRLADGGAPRAMLGRVADALLSQEMVYHRPVAPADIAAAARLLDSPHATGPANFEYHLAQTVLALAQRQWARAKDLADGLLREFPDHPRSTCLLAAALVELDRATDAVRVLERLAHKTTEADPTVLYALGRAYVAAGQPTQGVEELRQALEQEPDMASARLFLVMTLVGNGTVLEADADLRVLGRQMPDHPDVIRMQARLLVEKVDAHGLETLLSRRREGLGGQPAWEVADVLLAVRMAMDDTATVAQMVRRDGERMGPDGLWLLGRSWCQAPPLRRVLVARAVAGTLVDQVDIEPLGRVESPTAAPLPWPTRPGSTPAALTRPEPLDPAPLGGPRYVPWPQQTAMELLDVALERWPGDPGLVQTKAELAQMLGLAPLSKATAAWAPPAVGAAATAPAEAGQAVAPAPTPAPVAPIMVRLAELAAALESPDPADAKHLLAQMVGEHPWCEPAALMAVRRALQGNSVGRAADYIDTVRSVSPGLGAVAAARLDLYLGRPIEADRELRNLKIDATEESLYRMLTADARIWSELAQENQAGAEAVFSALVNTSILAEVPLQIRWADTVWTREPGAAAAIVRRNLEQGQPSARQADQLIRRALLLIEPDRLGDRLDKARTTRINEPIFRFYRAQMLADQTRARTGLVTIEPVIRRRPGAYRAQLLAAQLYAADGRPEEGRAILRQLVTQGGPVAEAARQGMAQIDKMNPASLPAPASAPAAPVTPLGTPATPAIMPPVAIPNASSNVVR